MHSFIVPMDSGECVNKIKNKAFIKKPASLKMRSDKRK